MGTDLGRVLHLTQLFRDLADTLVLLVVVLI
jgi:hypothetical protein